MTSGISFENNYASQPLQTNVQAMISLTAKAVSYVHCMSIQ